MFEKLSDHLNLLMDKVHISADELGRRTGVPASTIKKIRNRYSPNPTLATLVPLAAFFSLSISQLIGDEPLPEEGCKQALPAAMSMRSLPLLAWADLVSSSRSSSLSVISDLNCSEKAYALQVSEDDWKPFEKGTMLIVDPALSLKHRDFVILHKQDQPSASLKQIILDEGIIYIKSLIEGCPLVSFTDQYHILGVVVEYKKQLRNVSSL